MAPIFEQSVEMKKMVEVLVSKRSDLFDHIKPHMICCGVRVDKPAPTKQKSVLKIEGVRGSRTLLNMEIKYLITGYASMWDALTPEKKLAHLANAMKCIPIPSAEEMKKLAEKGEDYEYGKLAKPDVTDWKTFITELGVNWADNHTIIPDISEKKIEL